MPCLMATRGFSFLRGLPDKRIVPELGRRKTIDRLEHLPSARAEKAAEADDLPLAHLEIDIGDAALHSKIADLQDRDSRSARLAFPWGQGLLRAHHGRDERAGAEVALVALRNGHPVPEHGHLIGDLEYFGQAVRHIYDAHPLFLEPPDGGEETLGLLIGEGARGLVEDEDLDVGG